MAEKNALNFRKELKKFGVFYTPIEVCEIMKSYIPFDNIEEVYDPTVGQGNLLSVFSDDVKKYGQELFEEELEKAKNNLSNFEGYCGDTLTDDKFKGRKFQCISSNPPYSVAWEPTKETLEDERFKECGILAPKSKADWAFVLHCLNHLKDDGIAIILVFPGILYRGNAEGKIREWFIRNNYIDKVIQLKSDYFVDTNIATDILVIKKNKETTDIFFQDLQLEENNSRLVSFEEVEKERFTLSVSTYIEKPDTRPKINIDELNDSILQDDVRKIEAIIKVNSLIDMLEGRDINDENSVYKKFVEQLLVVLKKYEIIK